MPRLFLLGLLGAALLGGRACAQPPGEPPGTIRFGEPLRRLPPVDPFFEPPKFPLYEPLWNPASGELEEIPRPPADPIAAWPQLEIPLPEEPATVPAEKKHKPPPKLWEGTFELGMDGTDGNSETLNVRCGLNVKRKTEENVVTLKLDYNKKTNGGCETANRAFVDGRWERPFPDSPWSSFTHSTLEYDEFKAFDLRVTFDAGMGYQFVKTEKASLIGRYGGGFSHEIGGPDEDFVPEVVFGLDFERRLNKRQKITATAEYMPDATEFGEFRVNSQASWEVLLDADMNLSLKLSARDRYDSTPHGAKANDLDYAALLLWKL